MALRIAGPTQPSEAVTARLIVVELIETLRLVAFCTAFQLRADWLKAGEDCLHHRLTSASGATLWPLGATLCALEATSALCDVKGDFL